MGGICHVVYHWGRVTHICISKLSSIGSNGLSPDRRQAIIWTNGGALSICTSETNLSKSWAKFIHFHSRKCIRKCRLRNGGNFASTSICNQPCVGYGSYGMTKGETETPVFTHSPALTSVKSYGQRVNPSWNSTYTYCLDTDYWQSNI